MKRLLLFAIIGILLSGFISAAPITGSAGITDDNEVGSDSAKKSSTISNDSEDSGQIQNSENQETENEGEESELKIRNENRLRVGEGECASNCTCTGSVTKCQLQNGREMTITAGKSGNTIVQIKGQNMSTDVQLYKSEGKLYGDFSEGAKEIKVMPDQLKERVSEKLKLQDCSCDIELNEDGDYEVQTKKRARLLGFIPVSEEVKVYVDSETGETVRVRNSWWGFLAKDVEEEIVLGASCGTVTPGQNDACCQNEGYDYWDSEKEECLFY